MIHMPAQLCVTGEAFQRGAAIERAWPRLGTLLHEPNTRYRLASNLQYFRKSI